MKRNKEQATWKKEQRFSNKEQRDKEQGKGNNCLYTKVRAATCLGTKWASPKIRKYTNTQVHKYKYKHTKGEGDLLGNKESFSKDAPTTAIVSTHCSSNNLISTFADCCLLLLLLAADHQRTFDSRQRWILDEILDDIRWDIRWEWKYKYSWKYKSMAVIQMENCRRPAPGRDQTSPTPLPSPHWLILQTLQAIDYHEKKNFFWRIEFTSSRRYVGTLLVRCLAFQRHQPTKTWKKTTYPEANHHPDSSSRKPVKLCLTDNFHVYPYIWETSQAIIWIAITFSSVTEREIRSKVNLVR